MRLVFVAAHPHTDIKRIATLSLNTAIVIGTSLKRGTTLLTEPQPTRFLKFETDLRGLRSNILFVHHLGGQWPPFDESVCLIRGSPGGMLGYSVIRSEAPCFTILRSVSWDKP